MVDGYDRIIDPGARQRGQHMLHRAHMQRGMVGVRNLRAQTRVGDKMIQGRNIEPEIGATEYDAGIGRRRQQRHRHFLPAMQPHPDAIDTRLQRMLAGG